MLILAAARELGENWPIAESTVFLSAIKWNDSYCSQKKEREKESSAKLVTSQLRGDSGSASQIFAHLRPQLVSSARENLNYSGALDVNQWESGN